MEFEFKGNRLKLEKELSNLDKLVLLFVKVLDQQHVDYVIISGYIAILFGRSRQTDDVDLFVEEMPFEKFAGLWAVLEGAGFECINAATAESAYYEYLKDELAIRFAVKGTRIPNFELKFPKSDLSKYSLQNKIIVEIRNEIQLIKTSKLELQIAYKLYMSSDKDLEDAIHLWHLFKSSINQDLFWGFIIRLNAQDKVKVLE